MMLDDPLRFSLLLDSNDGKAQNLSEAVTWTYPQYKDAKFNQRFGSFIQGLEGIEHSVGVQLAAEWQNWLVLGEEWADGAVRVYPIKG